MLKLLWRCFPEMVSKTHKTVSLVLMLSYVEFWQSKYDIRYHVPRSWLKPAGNLMVVFEEMGGDPNWISLMKKEISSICSDMNEWQPNLVNWHLKSSGRIEKPLRPKAHLWCAPGQKISSIKFASFGTPQGSCGNYKQGSCHAHKSYDIFEKVYLHCITYLLNITEYFFTSIMKGTKC